MNKRLLCSFHRDFAAPFPMLPSVSPQTTVVLPIIRDLWRWRNRQNQKYLHLRGHQVIVRRPLISVIAMLTGKNTKIQQTTRYQNDSHLYSWGKFGSTEDKMAFTCSAYFPKLDKRKLGHDKGGGGWRGGEGGCAPHYSSPRTCTTSRAINRQRGVGSRRRVSR